MKASARLEAVSTNLGRVEADFVLAGIGIVPNCELAEAAGLACDNGISVDEYGATSDPDIFAAGDCTSHPGFAGGRVRLESVQNAIDQAKHAALAMVGKPLAYREVPWFWSDQYDLKLQIAGLARAGRYDRAARQPGPAQILGFSFARRGGGGGRSGERGARIISWGAS